MKHEMPRVPCLSSRKARDVEANDAARPDPLRAQIMAELWAAIDGAPYRLGEDSRSKSALN